DGAGVDDRAVAARIPGAVGRRNAGAAARGTRRARGARAIRGIRRIRGLGPAGGIRPARRPPALPKAGESEDAAVFAHDAVRLFAPAHRLPLVKAVGGNEAAAPAKRAAERGLF